MSCSLARRLPFCAHAEGLVAQTKENPLMNRMTILAATVFLTVASAQAQTPTSSQASLQSSSTQAQTSLGTQTQISVGAQSQASGLQQSSNAQASGTGSASASASAQADQKQIAISDGAAINANLAGPLDAGKNKPGDRVEAKVTQDVRQA